MWIKVRNVLSAAASRLVFCVALGAVSLVSACATLPPNAGSDPRDPLEKLNRNVFEFNRGFDDVVLKPLAEAWEFLLPVGVRQCLGNAFFNLRGPSTMINNLLQGKPESASEDMGRFLLNSSFGLAGCFDLASMVGIELNREDFGQTLGVWGLPGAFLMVPIFGPSSVRDAVGIYGVEPFLDLNFYIRNATFEYSVLGLRVVNERSELLQTGRLIDDAALDRYTFVRDGYLQRRRYLVHDGNPPRLPDDDLEPDDAAGPGTPPPSGGSGGGGAPIRKPDVKVKTETETR